MQFDLGETVWYLFDQRCALDNMHATLVHIYECVNRYVCLSQLCLPAQMCIHIACFENGLQIFL